MGRAKKKFTKTQPSPEKVKYPPLSEKAQVAIAKWTAIKSICDVIKYPIATLCVLGLGAVLVVYPDEITACISFLCGVGGVMAFIIAIILIVLGTIVKFLTKTINGSSADSDSSEI